MESERRESAPTAGAEVVKQPRSTPAVEPTLPPSEAKVAESPEYLLNRELTWLNFNHRVLAEADDERTPLLERVKFLSIAASNLDEFFMKRIGGLKQQVGAGMLGLTVDGRTPQQQLDACIPAIREFEGKLRRALLKIRRRLAEQDIRLANWDDLPEVDQQKLRKHYLKNIYPLLTPQATDPAHPFPFISNLSLNLLVALRYQKDQDVSLARVKVPVGGGSPRMLRVEGQRVFVPLEQVMARNLDLLFPGMAVESVEFFRVTRNANTELEEDKAEDLLSMIESELRERKFAPVVRIEVSKAMTAQHRGMLAAELGLDAKADVFDSVELLGARDMMELHLQADLRDTPGLLDPAHHPLDHPLLQSDRNVFHIVRDAGSILLHHPYDSFASSVERLLREAGRDPKVRAIKIALYRTSADSKVIQYLMDAARNGKQVAVVMELKARFDEAANIRWANRLGETGIHVTYGVVGLKTHCKLILVVRQDYNGLRRYAHIGTGNYHAGTARLYSDLGLITCDADIGRDLTELFNYLTTGYKPGRRYRKVLRAPKALKRGILDRIRREVEKHNKSHPGRIQFKVNALEDADVTRALYEAAGQGVQVELIVRDSCRLRPGIPGVSENVKVISIVDRFLEHARVFYFHNGGDEEYFIGSADLMKRNLESRVEVLVPVEQPELRRELRFLLDTQLKDRRSAWEMQPDGSYVQRQPQAEQEARGSQAILIEHFDARYKEMTRLKRRKPRGVASPR